MAEVVKPVYGQISLNYRKSFIALRVNQNNYFSLEKRSENKSRLEFRIDEEDLGRATTLLDEAGIAYVKKTKSLRISVDKQMISDNAERLRTLAKFVQEYWEG